MSWFTALPRLSTFNTLFSPDGSGTYRLQMYQYSLKLMERHPYGLGLSLTPLAYATEFPYEVFIFDPAQPHNLFLQIAIESGLIGLVFFIGFLYLALRKNFQTRNSFFWASVLYLVAAQIYPIYFQHKELVSFLFIYLGLSIQKTKNTLDV